MVFMLLLHLLLRDNPDNNFVVPGDPIEVPLGINGDIHFDNVRYLRIDDNRVAHIVY
jgi:hypothetical protein